jgi:hypothetical protein
MTGFPAPMMGLPFSTAPVVADVTGDGAADVVNNEDDQNLPAFDAHGGAAAGFPKYTGGWIGWSPAVGDLDGDGRNEVAALSREGYLFVWNTPGRAGASEAWNWHQDDWHTGRHGTDTRPPAVPRAAPGKPGQVCWFAPGDDWMEGRAEHYSITAFARDPRAARHGRSAALEGRQPGEAGTSDCVATPAWARYVTVQASDDAGLVSRAAVIEPRATIDDKGTG